MNIAIIADDQKKELLIQFCIAYKSVLEKHSLCGTATTAKLVREGAGINVRGYLAGAQGGDQQIGARIAYNEIDMVIFFRDPLSPKSYEPEAASIIRTCDMHNIPVATNIATAEALVLSLARGDMDWRDEATPEQKQINI